MKAVVCTRYGPPEVLQLTSAEKPVPGDGEILIKTMASTVTAADFRIRSFTVPRSVRLMIRLALGWNKPRKSILGVEVSGVVESVGKEVRLFKPGDEVFAATLNGFGGYAEYCRLPEKGPIAIKPSNLSFQEAAAIPIGASTALHFLKKVGVGPGTGLLIYGASGSVGTYAIQLAKNFGATVTAVCSTSNLEMVRSLGADKVIDYTTHDFRQQLEKYDVALLAVDKLPFEVAWDALNENGTYVNITSPFKSLKMLRASLGSKKKIVMAETAKDSAEDLIYLANMVSDGTLKVVIDRSYSLDDIVEAHRYVDKGRKKGNVVIEIREEG